MIAMRAIALGKLTAFETECSRLSMLVAEGVLDRTIAADCLYEAAIANGLEKIHGMNVIQRRIAGAFHRASSET